jgi:hypothetical protein
MSDDEVWNLAGKLLGSRPLGVFVHPDDRAALHLDLSDYVSAEAIDSVEDSEHTPRGFIVVVRVDEDLDINLDFLGIRTSLAMLLGPKNVES